MQYVAVDAPATENPPGPIGGKFVEGANIEDEADPVGIKWGEKPKMPEDQRAVKY